MNYTEKCKITEIKAIEKKKHLIYELTTMETVKTALKLNIISKKFLCNRSKQQCKRNQNTTKLNKHNFLPYNKLQLKNKKVCIRIHMYIECIYIKFSNKQLLITK